MNTRAKETLLEALRTSARHLPPHPYSFEADRWSELIMLILVESARISKTEALTIVSHLGAPARLNNRKHKKLRDELHDKFRETIGSDSFNHSAVEEATDSIRHLEAAVTKKFGGGIQTFLRAHGIRMAAELSQMLEESGIAKPHSRRIATVWLQNVVNMPILSSDDEHVQRFCADNKLTPTELLHLADEEWLNVSYLDDLLLFQHQKIKSVGKKTPKKRKTRE